jgi:hypothetical protein
VYTTGGVPAIAIAANFPTLNQSTTGLAATATALAANGTNCPAGSYPLGVDASGNAESCTVASGGSISALTGDVTASGSGSVAATVVKLNGVSLAGLATGLLKNTTTTGVPSIAASGTDYGPPTSGLATGILKSTTTTGAHTIAASGTDYGPATSGLGTGILKSTTGTGAHTIAVAGDFPTLNQATTSSAGSFTGSLAGDVTGTQGATVVAKVNGVALSGLSTGILRNTTGTGAPVIAVVGDFPTLNQSTTGLAATATALAATPSLCSGGQVPTGVLANGNATGCATPSGTTAAQYKTKSCVVTVGDPGAASSVLADDNDSPRACDNDSGVDWIITGVACYADAGSPTVTPILTGGTGTSLITGALTCGTGVWAAGTLATTPTVHTFSGSGSATCSSTPCSIDVSITTAGGAAKYLIVKIVGTY